MKTILLIGLVIEVIVGSIFMLGLLSPSPTQADTEEQNLMQLLPDIRNIYHAALTTPLQEVEHEIQDKDIAEFYHRLLQKYDLGNPEE